MPQIYFTIRFLFLGTIALYCLLLCATIVGGSKKAEDPNQELLIDEGESFGGMVDTEYQLVMEKINGIIDEDLNSESDQEESAISYLTDLKNSNQPSSTINSKPKEETTNTIFTSQLKGLDEDFKIPSIDNNLPKPPLVGIINNGETCYVNSVIQALYSLPGIRNYILTHESNNLLMTSLVHIFYQLFRARRSLNMNDIFLPTARGLLKNYEEITKNPGYFNLKRQDDPVAFWQWLMAGMPKLNEKFFQVKTKILHIVKDIPISEDINAECPLNIKGILLYPNKFVDELIEIEEEGEYTLDPQKLETWKPPVESGITSNLRQYFEERFGIDKKTTVSSVTRQKVIQLPPVLVLSALKYDHNVLGKDALWRSDVKTKFRPVFRINDKTYHLYSTVNYIPGPMSRDGYQTGHYTCKVCYDPVKNLWAHISDTSVVAVERDAPYGEADPYLFFYVEEETLEQWKLQIKPKIAIKNAFLSQVLQAAMDTREAVSKAFNFNVPIEDPVFNFQPPEEEGSVPDTPWEDIIVELFDLVD